MTRIEAIIFDCDGVLFDSANANIAFYDAVLGQLGWPPLDGEWRRRAHVMAVSQLFDAMFSDDSARRHQATQVARALDYGPFYELMEPVPELAALLATLKRGYRLAMASNRGKTVREVVRRFDLENYIELAVGVLDVERPKPYPDMIEKCVEHFAIAPAAALYVGDAETDRHAADAAGVQFLALGPAEWAPQHIVRLADLPAWLATR